MSGLLRSVLMPMLLTALLCPNIKWVIVFDKSTGALTLQPQGSNFLPADAKLNGMARITPEGRLEVTGSPFGSRNAPASCQALFEQPKRL